MSLILAYGTLKTVSGVINTDTYCSTLSNTDTSLCPFVIRIRQAQLYFLLYLLRFVQGKPVFLTKKKLILIIFFTLINMFIQF